MNSKPNPFPELKKMTDAGLLRLFSDEWDALSPEGKQAVKEEIRDRNLSTEHEIEKVISSDPAIDQAGFFLENAIRTRIPLPEITDYLTTKEFSYAALIQLAEHLKSKLEKKKQLTNPIRLSGISFSVIGLAIRMLPFRQNTNPLYFVISYLLILFGLLRWVHGWIGKRQSQKMLNYLCEWEQSLINKPTEYWTATYTNPVQIINKPTPTSDT